MELKKIAVSEFYSCKHPVRSAGLDEKDPIDLDVTIASGALGYRGLLS